MGIDDLLGQAKDVLSEHTDDVKAGLDKAADAAKTKLSDADDGKLDSVVEKAKDFLDSQKK
jgi:MT0933-like antitoxin protein